MEKSKTLEDLKRKLKEEIWSYIKIFDEVKSTNLYNKSDDFYEGWKAAYLYLEYFIDNDEKLFDPKTEWWEDWDEYKSIKEKQGTRHRLPIDFVETFKRLLTKIAKGGKVY